MSDTPRVCRRCTFWSAIATNDNIGAVEPITGACLPCDVDESGYAAAPCFPAQIFVEAAPARLLTLASHSCSMWQQHQEAVSTSGVAA